MVRARIGYTLYYSLLNRHEEALTELAEAQRLDPVSPLLQGELGWFLFRARRYDDTAGRCQEALELDPANLQASLCLLEAAVQLSRPQLAADEALRSMRLQGTEASVLERLSAAEPASVIGEFRQWRLDRFKGRKDVSTPQLAIAKAALGDADGVLSALERAYRERSAFLLYVRVDPRFDAFVSDRRFGSLMGRVEERLAHS